MKFVKALLIMIAIINICVMITSKKNKHRTKSRTHNPWIPDQFGRNYRKPWPEPSMNPLPQQYTTGPISNYATHTPDKYLGYNRRVSDIHRYYDNTGRLDAKARKAGALRKRRRN